MGELHHGESINALIDAAYAGRIDRRNFCKALVAEKLPVQGYHFQFPALARIEKAGDGYRVVPMSAL